MNCSKEKAKEETNHPQSGVNVVAGEEIEESQSEVPKEILTPTQVPVCMSCCKKSIRYYPWFFN